MFLQVVKVSIGVLLVLTAGSAYIEAIRVGEVGGWVGGTLAAALGAWVLSKALSMPWVAGITAGVLVLMVPLGVLGGSADEALQVLDQMEAMDRTSPEPTTTTAVAPAAPPSDEAVKTVVTEFFRTARTGEGRTYCDLLSAAALRRLAMGNDERPTDGMSVCRDIFDYRDDRVPNEDTIAYKGLRRAEREARVAVKGGDARFQLAFVAEDGAWKLDRVQTDLGERPPPGSGVAAAVQPQARRRTVPRTPTSLGSSVASWTLASTPCQEMSSRTPSASIVHRASEPKKAHDGRGDLRRPASRIRTSDQNPTIPATPKMGAAGFEPATSRV